MDNYACYYTEIQYRTSFLKFDTDPERIWSLDCFYNMFILWTGDKIFSL